MNDLNMLVGETLVAMSHEPYRENIGVMNLDVVTSGGTIYRFATDEIEGERTADGRTNEHYSLTLERAQAGNPLDERTDLAGTVVKADLIRCDEWLGALDDSIESIGENPRMLFDGKVGSCPPGGKCMTVICGVVLQSEDWQLLVRTHAFPQHLDFTTEPTLIGEFLNQYSVENAATEVQGLSTTSTAPSCAW
jgi:hypothetical protein